MTFEQLTQEQELPDYFWETYKLPKTCIPAREFINMLIGDAISWEITFQPKNRYNSQRISFSGGGEWVYQISEGTTFDCREYRRQFYNYKAFIMLNDFLCK